MTASEKSSQSPPRKLGPTSYGPLPGSVTSASGSLSDAWAAFPRRFQPLFRVIAWLRSTAEPSDTPLGRFAAWAEQIPSRFGWRFAGLGALIGIGVAVYVVVTHQIPEKEYTRFLISGPFVGAFFGFFIPLNVFVLLSWAVSYWRWLAGYAAFLIVVVGVRRFVFGLP